MAWLIMNDEIDYSSMYYPTHIVSKDKELLPVFIGASQTMIRGLIGLYVRDEDYHKIRHDKAYIFVHDPDVEADEVQHVDWEQVPDCTDPKNTGREHLHLWKEPEFEGQNHEGGEA